MRKKRKKEKDFITKYKSLLFFLLIFLAVGVVIGATTITDQNIDTPTLNVSNLTIMGEIVGNLNISGNVDITSGNLSLQDKITFRLGETIDNLIDGWIQITGGLNVTNNLEVNGSATFSGGNLSVNNSDLFVNVNLGKVGIGTSNPTYDLSVVRTIVDSDGGIEVIGTTTSNRASFHGSSSGAVIQATDNDWSTATFAKFDVGDNAWTFGSDKRWKEDITTIDNALYKITSIRGVHFNWKNIPGDSEGVGVIAQEVQPYMPRIISEDNEGYLGVAYSSLTPYLIEAIKEQQVQIEKLKSENDLLKDRLLQIEERLNSIELICKW